MWSFNSLIVAGGLLRVGLILFGRIQDAYLDVKYTDIDYHIFTGAARYVLNGASPYYQATYRYTPILAWLMLPNIVLSPEFGKFLFCAFDLIVARLLFVIVKRRTKRESDACIAAAIWLFNPLTAVVSSRGNAESVQAFLVLGALHALTTNRPYVGAIFHGLAIHFKLFPVIYLPAVFLYLGSGRRILDNLRRWDFFGVAKCILGNYVGIVYSGVVVFVFGITSLVFYWLYGYRFVYETYLYHFERKDLQHNFSAYFYLFYCTSGTKLEPLISKFAFLPQAISVVVTSFAYFEDLPASWFLATAFFVSLNKVCTSQYFLWYLTLLPACISSFQVTRKEWVSISGIWLLAQGLWLFWAYLLEFQAWRVRAVVGLCSLIFLYVNLSILRFLWHRYNKPVIVSVKQN